MPSAARGVAREEEAGCASDYITLVIFIITVVPSPVGVRTRNARATNTKIAVAINKTLTLQSLNMAPTTRRVARVTPPPGPSECHEADTVKKCRFYDAWDKVCTHDIVYHAGY
jgi:hypothetical protein